jgi:hypothetical protein
VAPPRPSPAHAFAPRVSAPPSSGLASVPCAPAHGAAASPTARVLPVRRWWFAGKTGGLGVTARTASASGGGGGGSWVGPAASFLVRVRVWIYFLQFLLPILIGITSFFLFYPKTRSTR